MAVKHNARLECTVCHNINYLTFRNAKTVPTKLELNKYCKHCQKATPHKETKAK
ncbi:MAG: 50S ribosomal protein L33 [Mycoplasmataceae bacterium]|jgi:large subunit ribosomal protein L33|nr:50S ribosomal protein L33 [Mycoplasmataceae bacterium]